MADIAAGRLSAAECAANFADLVPPLAANEARVASERCLFCHDAPCVTACPTSIDIPLFIRQIATRNPIGAAGTILTANIMGATCARVCPTENLCEGACVRVAAEGKPVEIGRLQRHATDVAAAAGKRFFTAGPDTGRRVAVVGAGPAGLSCAHGLAVAGHAVTLFEAREKAGGLNEYGVAAYKVTGGIAQAEIDRILEVGNIAVVHGRRLGRDFTLADLAAEHDAVFLGIGLGATNELGLGPEPSGVIDAVEAIAALRQASDLSALPVGRRVVVVGGGMTAIDIATQTKLLGAEEVTIVYRRGPDAMPASEHERDVARKRGVTLRFGLRPIRLVAENGALSGVELAYTATRAGKLVDTGETLTLGCDQLFKAIGQTLLAEDLAAAGLAMTSGKIAVDAHGRASLAKVWAGGDCVAGGPDLTVAAVEDGKRAAASIDAELRR